MSGKLLSLFGFGAVMFFYFSVPACVNATNNISINEIAWMGSVESANDEWIELYNSSAEDVSLDGWVLLSLDGAPSIGLAGVIKANSFYLLERSDDDSAPTVAADLIYSGSLSNSGEYLELRDDSGGAVDALDCTDAWLAGSNENKFSMQKVGGKWVDSCEVGGSPRGENIVCAGDDEEDIEEEDDDSESLELNVEDEEDVLIERNNPHPDGHPLLLPRRTKEMGNDNDSEEDVEDDSVIISEIMPNCVGVDTDEWIELYNKGKKQINLKGWVLSDARSEYEFGDIYLRPGKYLLLTRAETNIALNNSKDKLYLRREKGGENLATVAYVDAPVGISLMIDDNSEWLWTTKLTPGEENILVTPNREPLIDFEVPKQARTGEYFVCDASDSIDPDGDSLEYSWQIGDTRISSGILVSHSFTNPGTYKIKLAVSDGNYSLEMTKKITVTGVAVKIDSFKVGEASIEIEKILPEDSRELDKSQKLPNKKELTRTVYDIPVKKKTTTDNRQIAAGVVTTLPGTLASQYFYITGSNKSYQVYSYKKDFSEVKIGDYVEAIGEESLINDEVRIKTKSRDDISIISSDNDIEIVKLQSDAVSDDLLGYLVEIEGEVVKKDGLYLYVDDGQGEFKMYLKKSSGIKSSLFSVGLKLKVLGILSKANGDYRILPRNINDIEIITNDEEGIVLGEISTSSKWSLESRKADNSWLRYFFVLLVTLVTVGGVTIYQIKKNS
jgi:hypothetical protein